MTDFVSVIISTYNPDPSRFNRVLDALKMQTLPLERWELLIIDNNSSIPLSADLSWHPGSRIIPEPKPGLTYGRMRGFSEAGGDILLLVDDDNVLAPGYLLKTADIFKANPKLGAIGGRSLPDFEAVPPVWIKQFYGNLAIRDLGSDIIIAEWDGGYPEASPIGAGMAIRRGALDNYITKINAQHKPITDRTGKSLSSGGDNDIVLEILKAGWAVGYFPSLSLYHIIPVDRTGVEYLSRLLNHTNKSWILLLENHKINAWKKIKGWSVPLRKIKAWFTYKAWQNKVNYIRWRGACGTFDGLSEKNFK
jgi:glycosyltransferase involved in cell wall biosynthesis